MSEPAGVTVYEFVGGEPTFVRLVDAFYRGIESDPLLRPMYPPDLDEARKHMTLFLIQYFDGPRHYEALRGHPRLRMRHMPFVVNRAARDAWVRHMSAAVDEVEIPEPARGMMLQYFEQTATFMMNRAD